MTTDKPATLTAARCRELADVADSDGRGPFALVDEDKLRAMRAGLRAYAAILEAVEAAPESPEAICDGVVGYGHAHVMDGICHRVRTAIRRRDARHEAEKQALRAEANDGRLCKSEQHAQRIRLGTADNQRLATERNAAQADADALRAANVRLQSLVDSYGPTVEEHNAIERRQEAEIDALRALRALLAEAGAEADAHSSCEACAALSDRIAAALGGKAAPPTAAQIDLAARALWTIGNARIGVREWEQVGRHYLFEAEAALLAARGLQWNGTPPAERVDGGKAAATGGEHG